MKKIIDLPVIYEADVVPNGCRKNRIVNMIDYHPFEIEDLSDNIPELVMVSSNHKMQTIRKQNNVFYIPVTHNELNTLNKYNLFFLNDEKQYIEQFKSFLKPRKNLLSITELTNENKLKLTIESFVFYPFKSLSKNIVIKNDSIINKEQIKKNLSSNENRIINDIQSELNDYVVIHDQFYRKYFKQPLLSLNPVDLLLKKVIIENDENYGLFISMSMIDLINPISKIDDKIKILNPDAFDMINESYIAKGIINLLLKELNNINIYNIMQKNKSDDEISQSKQIDQDILKLSSFQATYNFKIVLEFAKQADCLFDLMTQKTKLHYRTLKDKNIKSSLILGNCFHDLTLSIQKIQEYLMRAEYNNVKNI